MNLAFNPTTFLILLAITIILLNLYKIYQNNKKKQRQVNSYHDKSIRITNQNLRISKIEKDNIDRFKDLCKDQIDGLNRIDKLDKDIRDGVDRLDKLEIDVTYIKDFTIKKLTQKQKVVEPIKSDTKIESKLMNLLKNKKPKKVVKKKFSDLEIDKEMRKKLGEILFLDNEQLFLEQKKAYARLWARNDYNNKQKQKQKNN